MQSHPSQLTPAETRHVLTAVTPIEPLVADIGRLLFDLRGAAKELPALALAAMEPGAGSDHDLAEAQARASATAATLQSLLGVLALRLGPAITALDAALTAAENAEFAADHFPAEA